MCLIDDLDKIFSKLAKKEERYGKKSLTSDETVFLNAMHAYGLLQNGGLENFFVWEDATPAVADYFDEVGMNGIAEIIRSFFALLPNIALPHLGSQERDRVLSAEITRIEGKVETLNEELLTHLRDDGAADKFFMNFVTEKQVGASKWRSILRLVNPIRKS